MINVTIYHNISARHEDLDSLMLGLINTYQLAMFAKSVELCIITVLVNYAGIKCYEIYRI